MQFIATFIVLAIGGMLNAGYLTYERLRQKPLVCPLDHDCSVVTESKWSNILGVRNEYLGLLFYIAVFFGGLALVLTPDLIPDLNLILMLGTGAGLLFSIFLTAVQIFAIKDYCFYCIISAIITFLLFINSFFI